jgi:predicted DNA-binding transcriptional regulator YafY
METVERIEGEGKPIAIIVRSDFSRPGVNFFSPFDFSQQLGILVHPPGHEVKAHVHNVIARDVRVTQEVLHLIEGKIEITLYTENKKWITTRVLNQGDTILLAYGGHGIKILEPAKILEVKQGPYAGKEDKEFF